MKNKKTNILVLCTGNSARSIIGEVLINHLGKGRVCGFSAGSTPVGKVNPYAIELLKNKGLPAEDLRSKSWDEFTTARAPKIDIVLTICSNAAGETCPVWPGHPVTAHWGIPDPAAVETTLEEIKLTFSKTFDRLEKRIRDFLALPFEGMNSETLKNELNIIGRMNLQDMPPNSASGLAGVV